VICDEAANLLSQAEFQFSIVSPHTARGVLASLSAAGHVIVQRIGPPRLSVRGLANDRKDLLHDITADAAGSASQQILDPARISALASSSSTKFQASSSDMGIASNA
jgi:hypothetical protein